MKDKIINILLTLATKMQSQRYFAAIKNAFSDLMPIIIAGSFCTLFQNAVCSVSKGFVSVANIPGMSWLNALSPIFSAANYGTMNFLTIGAVILISMHLGEHYNIKDKVLPLTAIGAFISLCTTSVSTKVGEETVSIANALSNTFTSAQGLFVGMFVAIVSAEIYCLLVRSGKLEIKMPDSVPSNVSKSFAVLFPCTVTILAVSAFGLAFKSVTGMTVFNAITNFIQAPLASVLTGLPGYCLILFVTLLLWFFGIHGTQVMKPITEPILLATFAMNEAAYAAGTEIPEIIVRPFLSLFGTMTGAGITGGLIIAILLFSKRDDYKAVAKLALPLAAFNINEPVIFGLPIVLNPILAIPFLITPIASTCLAYFLTTIGFCGRLVVNVPWTTPMGIAGFLAGGGNVGAAVTQVLCLVLSFLIYTPFVLISNKQKAGQIVNE
ncbi:MAG: PTS sugar transporter subunit IIC [Erysipelotrichia bacterium]|nr:PTS sugar transporter subunit IIC [Erysipelotrichia bacterium]